ncbi:MAG: hypothetical protein E7597_02010 [Ruminococcaceae bacterium]|nr:hypothetical protein [Oscillospiraceae bacterium]
MKSKRLLTIIEDIDDKYIEEADTVTKRRTANRVLKYASLAACLCLVSVVGALLLKNVSTEKAPSASDAGTENIALCPFEATAPDPDEDWFAEDELHHVEVILQGNRIYTQLSESECAKFTADGTLNSADYGEKLGTVKEIGAWDKADSTPCAQEPRLAGCEVYYYKPVNCEGLIIVQGNGACCLFGFNNFAEEGNSIADVLKVKGALNAEDIESISFEIQVPNGTLIQTQKEGTVIAPEKISTVMDVITKLTPYVRESNLSGDPDWLCEAREEYKKLDKEQQTVIFVKLMLKNGLWVDFEYQPNLGSGFIYGNRFLSEEDNAALSTIFN